MKTTLSNDVLAAAIAALRAQSPLIHNITNYVVMNNSANALLAIGASPVMAHWTAEMEEMTAIANALVINIGTLDDRWIDGMKTAGFAASKRGIPIVLDPVGAGATSQRTGAALEIIACCHPTIIRGNASEIMALVDAGVKTKEWTAKRQATMPWRRPEPLHARPGPWWSSVEQQTTSPMAPKYTPWKEEPPS